MMDGYGRRAAMVTGYLTVRHNGFELTHYLEVLDILLVALQIHQVLNFGL